MNARETFLSAVLTVHALAPDADARAQEAAALAAELDRLPAPVSIETSSEDGARVRVSCVWHCGPTGIA